MKKPEDFLKRYESALATQSWDKVEPLIHENCVATFSEGTYKGKQEVESAFRSTFQLIKEERYTISNVDWVLKTNELAVLVFNFKWSGLIHGQHMSGGGRGTSTLINCNGQWQLLAEHLGPDAQ